MKKICFEKKSDSKKRIKKVFINSTTEDKECMTKMNKSFLYRVNKTNKVDLNLEAPQVNIKKTFDTQKNIEIFSLQVTGKFFITHNRMLLEVYFQHKLYIEIHWKMKKISPKKSEVLA
ncbi:hypothetical protein MNBD_UNCLBAC01-1809 [hydrothermal vent metagenome]|uniref:Uncharacterized protein n=1 Tax=hydrothermal vent metagenome TaxID=652676 RepID=A0A3B1CZ74_9ZZZZ